MTRGRVIAVVVALAAVIALLLWWRSGSSEKAAAPAGGAAGDVSARDDSAAGPRRSVGSARRNPAADVEGAVVVGGRVVDAAGAGVEGVDVVFAHKLDEIVTSGFDGSFSISLTTGSYDVRAVGERLYAQPQKVEVTGATPPVTITVARMSRARGWVIDAAGAPVRDAVVATKIKVPQQAAADKDGLLPSTTTDANGVFEVDLVPGLNWITADHPTLGHGRVRLADVPEGEREEDLRIQLAAYAVIRGVVRSPDGAAIAGATVTGTTRARAVRRSTSATSGTDGTFTLAEMVPGDVTIDATADGYGPADPQNVEVVAGTSPAHLTMTLNEPRSLSGRVYDASGEPVYDAKVKVQRDGSDVTFRASRTDVDGAFDVSGLDDGPHTVTVVIGGRLRASRKLSHLPETLDLTLEP